MRIWVSSRAASWLAACHPDARERAKVRAKFDHIFALVAKFGPHLGPPHTEYLGEGTWEARCRRPSGWYPLFFCQEGDWILVAGGVVKNKGRLHPRQIEQAQRWCEEARRGFELG